MNARKRFDQLLELIFSIFRWFFLILSASLYFYLYSLNPNEYKPLFFIILLAFGILYMTIAEIVLHRAKTTSRLYVLTTKYSVVFDYIAFIWLISITGGVNSPLMPIAYLIILHVSVYWGYKGGVISSFTFVIGYTILFLLIDKSYTSLDIINYLIDIVFMLVFGFFGGIIISQERKHLNEKILFKDMAEKDFLTGLYNHRKFQEDLKKTIENNKSFVLVMGDIDDFKEVNDKYGHVVGDTVLQEIGRILSSDIPVTKGLAYRYGGEEISMILYLGHDEAYSMIDSIKKKITNKIFKAHDNSFSVTISFGIIQRNEQNSVDILQKADQLLYQAKKGGKDQISIDNSYTT